MPGEKRSHRGHEADRIVAHDRVAGARYLGDRTAGQLAAKPLGGRGGKDRTLGAADEERGGANAAHLLPEGLELQVGRAEDRRVELVGPAPVGRLAKRMAETLADVLERAPRVEGVGSGDRLFEGVEVAPRELAGDRVAAGAFHR